MRKTLLTLALGISLCANAQIEIVKSGQTRIGIPIEGMSSGEIHANSIVPDLVLDPLPITIDNTASLNIWGISNKSNLPDIGDNMGHITFGCGTYANIAGNSAKGILRLHARNRLALVLGRTDTAGLTWSLTDNAITSTYNIKAPSFLTTSDSRLKKNVESLTGSHESLLDVNPVSYNLTSATEAVPAADKAAKLSDTNGTEASDDRLHFGFIAQEIQKIYPNLVVEGEDGLLAIDYTGFIPLLVDAYKDLAGKVKEQEEVIDALLGQRGPSYMPASVNDLADVKASLKQNRPNPFNTTTTIECSVPQSVASAFICVYDLQGKQVHRIDIRERGEVANVIDASSLAPGMYIYSLIADGAEIDSKRMIITD